MNSKEKDFIKEQSKKYNDILYKCDEDIEDFNSFLCLIKKHYPDKEIDVVGDLKEVVERNLKTTKNLKKITKKMIKMLQSKCEHHMQHMGNDSHYSHEKCIYCGFSEKV